MSRVSILFPIFLLLAYLYTSYKDIGTVSFMGLLFILSGASILGYFWHYIYKANGYLKEKNIQLDYEPIVWPLFIKNIIDINRDLKDSILEHYIDRIKFTAIYLLLFVILFFIIPIFTRM